MANSLNIDPSKFGFDDKYMFLHDPLMYLDFHGGEGLVSLGYLESEKTWRQTLEYAVFETGIPKTEVRRDVIKQGFELEGIVKQFQPEVLALVMQRRYDETDAVWRRVIAGSEIPAAIFPSCMLVTQTVDGNELRLYIRRLQITAEDLEVTLGGATYSSVPFKGTAQKDPTPLETNADWAYNPSYADQDNIAFWAWPKESASS